MNIKERFGKLVAAQRKRRGWTQHDLAEQADLSDDMIARVEAGSIGASFTSIEKIADALEVDVGELFTPHLKGAQQRKALADITTRLAGMSDEELVWVAELLAVGMRRPR